jgi:hypothetical protein
MDDISDGYLTMINSSQNRLFYPKSPIQLPIQKSYSCFLLGWECKMQISLKTATDLRETTRN